VKAAMPPPSPPPSISSPPLSPLTSAPQLCCLRSPLACPVEAEALRPTPCLPATHAPRPRLVRMRQDAADAPISSLANAAAANGVRRIHVDSAGYSAGVVPVAANRPWAPSLAGPTTKRARLGHVVVGLFAS
jgi:hypothetical protein